MIVFFAAAAIAVLAPARLFDCQLDKIATTTLESEAHNKVISGHHLGIFVPPVLTDTLGGSQLFSQMSAFEKVKFADKDKVVAWRGLRAVKLLGESGFFATDLGFPQITNIVVELQGTAGDAFKIAVFHTDAETGKPDNASGLMGRCALTRGDKAKVAFEAMQ